MASYDRLRDLRVLVVDDVDSARSLLKAVLQAFGIRTVLESEDGEAGLLKAQSVPLDLVITDFSMKPVNGVEFIRRLRTPGPAAQPNLAVLMLSNHTELSLVKAAIAAGVNDFLAKPGSCGALEKKLLSMREAPLPVIQAPDYCGPDRRRARSNSSGFKRRAGDFSSAVH